ncbi:hypothetical protein PSDI105340_20660 [Pseudoalteromonas distincta]
MSMMQTAEGAFDEMTNIAYRMKELATQGANGTNGADEYTALNAEYGALEEELKSIMDNTSFGGTNLLNPSDGKFDLAAVTFQVGSSTAETLEVDVTSEVQDINTAVAGGALGALTGATPAASATASQGAMDLVDDLIDDIGSARSALGASMNRLDHTMNNVTNMKENTQAAASTLMDADFAAETSNMTKQQLLMNSGISVLSTANSTTQMIGSLLR